jgi:IS30 family transposase
MLAHFHRQARGARMKNYTELTEAERNQIYALKQAGHKKSAIALQSDRNRSTIGRELQRIAKAI